jgi:hypothetical protein
MAETKKDALAAFDAFVETWGVKYDEAVECLIKHREALLVFYDFPAEHWKHLRTTDEMDKRFFFMTENDDYGNRCTSILLFGRAVGHSSVPAIDLPAAARRGGQGWPHLRPPQHLDRPEHGGTLAWNGIAFLAWLELAVTAIMVVGRGLWRSVMRRLQASADAGFWPPWFPLRHEAFVASLRLGGNQHLAVA